ncbi:MAG: PPK2 family polyphosphate kinase [Pseudomonadota bacterium]|nr:PPK2 family polyphosphate kinase [Pseudomonadota bacterium]
MSSPFTDFPDTPQRVQQPTQFRPADWPTRPVSGGLDKARLKAALADEVDALHDLQRRLHAEARQALLVVFQAMDAGGKDSTIRAVFSGVNPSGVRVTSFKAPSSLERSHDFLWRTVPALPARGQIGVFNRSYYEDVLIARVHPELAGDGADEPAFWDERLRSITAHERHLAHNRTVVLKFWLHLSYEQQRQRFLRRLRKPDKHWKFDESDVRERAHWDDYMAAYEAAIATTHMDWAPWYVIPADDKPAMRLMVAQVIRHTLEAMAPQYPTVSADRAARLQRLAGELDPDGD